MFTILLADDDHGFFKTLKYLLGDEFHILHAPDCLKAKNLLSDEDDVIDLCLIDYILPDGNGVELLRLIRKNSPTLPIIFITGYPTLELCQKVLSLDYNADYFLTKPIDLNDLINKMNRCFQERNEIGSPLKFQKPHPYSIESHKPKRSKQVRQEAHRNRELRLKSIHTLIETSPGKWTTGNLCHKFSVSRTQIHRDVQTLIERGTNITTHGKGYILENE